MITYDELKQNFRYNSKTGVFKRMYDSGFKIAGTKDQNGYIKIKYMNKQYYAHRLAWLWVHGYFPEESIDHINGDTSDNRIVNLRETSHQCNMRNRKKHSNNTSGVNGVCAVGDNWQAYIKVAGKMHYLGQHSCLFEAAAHRLAAEQCLGWEN